MVFLLADWLLNHLIGDSEVLVGVLLLVTTVFSLLKIAREHR